MVPVGRGFRAIQSDDLALAACRQTGDRGGSHPSRRGGGEPVPVQPALPLRGHARDLAAQIILLFAAKAAPNRRSRAEHIGDDVRAFAFLG